MTMKIVRIFILLVIFVCWELKAVEGAGYYEKAVHTMVGALPQISQDVYEEYLKTHSPSEEVSTFLKSSFNSTRSSTPIDVSKFCGDCISGVDSLLYYYKKMGIKRIWLELKVTQLCIEKKVGSVTFCAGMVYIFADTIFTMFDKDATLSGAKFCSIILSCGEMPAGLEFTINVDNPGKVITESKSSSNSNNEFQILHITDIHLDRFYNSIFKADCSDYICCRWSSGIATKSSEKAGHWGDYRNCDLPFYTIIAFLDQVIWHALKSNIKIIYYTGDIVDHAIWEATPTSNKISMNIVFSYFYWKFANKGIKFYPIVGNHETSPVNVFAPSQIKKPKWASSQWLYDQLADNYCHWLPASALATVRKGGYYTIPPSADNPKLRIIAINNNDCFIYNLWIVFSRDSMIEQLQWLQNTLYEAEKAGEKVHLLAHVPSGDSECFKYWSREFRRIVDRYHKTISAIFNGHTHLQYFTVYYSKQNPNYAVNVAWNGGSLTPFSYVNPNYMVYTVDKTDYQVNDLESWITNLKEANNYIYRPPVWYKQYSFKQASGLSDLSPASLDKLVTRMSKDEKLLHEFWKFSIKGGEVLLQNGCDKACKQNILCRLVTSEAADNKKCVDLKSKSFNSANFTQAFKSNFLSSQRSLKNQLKNDSVTSQKQRVTNVKRSVNIQISITAN